MFCIKLYLIFFKCIVACLILLCYDHYRWKYLSFSFLSQEHWYFPKEEADFSLVQEVVRVARLLRAQCQMTKEKPDCEKHSTLLLTKRKKKKNRKKT